MGVSSGIADWLKAGRIAGRRAADFSFGSGSSFEWTLRTKAGPAAENRSASENRLDVIDWSNTERTTHKNQGDVEVLVVFLDVVRIVLGHLPLVHRAEVKAGVVLDW